MARIDPEKREEWDAMMDMPLPGEGQHEPTPEQVDADGQNFMAAMLAQGGA